MIKKELIARVAEKASEHKDAKNLVFSKKETGVIIDTLMEVIKEAVAEGEEITLQGIGKFGVKEVGERSGVSKLKGEEKPWKVEAHKEPSFRINQTFRKSMM